jgi:cephalosporin hydroxylase
LETELIIQNAYKIGLFQIKEEITQLVNFLKTKNINNVIEIGTKLGGTLYIWHQISSGHIFSIDLQGGEYGGWLLNKHPYLGNILAKRNKYFSKNYSITHHQINGDSHSPLTKEKLLRIIQNKKVDLLFMDGDHTYNGIKQDLIDYQQFVNNGGFVVFHDINDSEHHRSINVGVYKLWNELTGEKYEFNIHSYWGGIGIWRKQSD